MDNDLISVVIPIYNAEECLDRCLKSVKNQSYKNIEIILVDDGSIDNSKKICNKYCHDDNRFKYFYNKNQGVAKTRNFGISVSNGGYISFVDSDDYISPYYIEILYNSLINSNSDISTCLYKNVYNKEEKYLDVDCNYIHNIYSNEEALKKLLVQDKIDASFWGKLYKKDLFNNIVINDYKIFEDLDTMYKLFAKSNKICLCNIILYYYFIRLDSLSHTNFSDSNLLVLEILDNMEKEINKKFPNLTNEMLMRKVSANFYIVRNTNKEKSYYLKSKKFIIDNRKKILDMKNISKKLRCGIYLSYISFDLIRPMFNLINKIKKYK